MKNVWAMGSYSRGVNGVASRGKMMGKSFDQVEKVSWGQKAEAASLPLVKPKLDNTLILHSSLAESLASVDLPLTDPFLQDLDQNSRFYLFYFDRHVCRDLVIYDDNTLDQNPFHELISFTKKHEVLFHAVLAISALHLSNVIQRQLEIKPALSCLPCLDTSSIKSASATQTKKAPPLVYQHALLAKQKALRLLYLALEDSSETTVVIKLASVLLFINLELIDSGKNDWRPHVEGAGVLIESLQLPRTVQTPSTDCFRDCLVSNCLVYEILGTTLTMPLQLAPSRPRTLNISSTLQSAEVNNYLSCPAELLEIVLLVPQFLLKASERPTQSPSTMSCRVEHSSLLLIRTQRFDAVSWATTLQRTSPCKDLEKRMHIAYAHQAAVCIYILDSFQPIYIESEFRNEVEQLVTVIIDHLTFITPSDGLYKATCWPTFVAGAATATLLQQKWALDRLCRLWEVLPWGYIKSAIEILEMIWQRYGQSQTIVNWVQTLRMLNIDWLVA